MLSVRLTVTLFNRWELYNYLFKSSNNINLHRKLFGYFTFALLKSENKIYEKKPVG